MRDLNDDGAALIAKFEGFRSEPYLCPAGIPTIGYGTTHYGATPVRLGDKPITEKEAMHIMKQDIDSMYGAFVNRYVNADLTQNQYNALTSFVYNVGGGNFLKSTLLKKLNSGDHKGAADEFLKWDHAGHKKLAGLTKRRRAERELFLA